MDDETSSQRNRDSLLLLAEVSAKGTSWSAKVRNISTGGLMAEPCLDLANGDVVAIDLRNIGRVSGRVAWVIQPRFGIAFDKPINHQAVRGSITPATAPTTLEVGLPRRRI